MENYTLTFETWNKVADWYETVFMDFDLYNDSYDLFCEHLPSEKANVLEIGCGPGNITKYLLGKRPDIKIEGTDVAENMIVLAKANNPSATFRVMDCRDITTLTTQYDAVMCGFCLPYLSKMDCEDLIKNVYNLLKDNGIAYFSFVEGDYEKSGLHTNSKGDSLYFYFHQKAFFDKKSNR
jgi:trans-aconitate methyltransferase